MSLKLLIRKENLQARKDREERIKLAAVASGKYNNHELFPGIFAEPEKKKQNLPLGLVEPQLDEDIDYSSVQWSLPEQDEWLQTEKLLQQHQKSTVTESNEREKPMVIDFDKDIPPMPDGNLFDRDDLEWE